MGDAFLNLMKVNICTTQILERVFRNNLAIGLDGVDIGTVFPNNSKDLHILNQLNQSLERHWIKPFGKNVYNTDKPRSPLRIFYSLHRFDGLRSKYLIPNSEDFNNIKHTLFNLKELCGIDVIFHQVFIDDQTDMPWLISELKNLFRGYFEDFELRILRYNECSSSPYKESSKFDEIVKELNESIPIIKYQISPGSEIKAACGQFLMDEYKQIKQIA